MRKKNKRHIFLPLALLIYSAVMAVITFPKYREHEDWNEYFTVIGVCVLMAILLFFVLKRRKKYEINSRKWIDR